ncbi:site-specific integrase [Luteibacter sp.]|jgi:integrase|uniref:site-specific integrase n=1 Tax=Luteibacter sp. TaxID=1886636 RepID=UPI002F404F28
MPPNIDDVVALMEGGGGKRLDIKTVDPRTNLPLHLKTNGSDGDNAAGLEALRIIFASPLPATPGPVVSAPVTGPSLKVAIKTYGETEALGLKADTWDARRRALQSFSDYLDEQTPVGGITRARASEWTDALLRDGKSKQTVRNYTTHVAALFDSLAQKGQVEGNPVAGLVKIKTREKKARRALGHRWEPFDLADLQQIYHPANMRKTRMDHVRWGALVGLYTGARVGEVAQLYLRDFLEIGGIACMKICADSDEQRVKSEASHRLVPLHPDLLRLGLMERVEWLRGQGEKRLFPGVRLDGKAGVGNALSKGFSYYISQLGIKPQRDAGRVGFHGLRKNVIQMIQGSEVSEERRRAFVGHEGGEDVHKTNYMRPWTPAELTAVTDGLKWSEWLDVEGLRGLLSPRNGI